MCSLTYRHGWDHATVQALLFVFNAPQTINILPRYLRILQLYSLQHKFEVNVQENSKKYPTRRMITGLATEL